MFSTKNFLISACIAYFSYSLFTFYSLFKTKYCLYGDGRYCSNAFASKNNLFDINLWINRQPTFNYRNNDGLLNETIHLNESIKKIIYLTNFSALHEKSHIYSHIALFPHGTSPSSRNSYTFDFELTKMLPPRIASFKLIKFEQNNTNKSLKVPLTDINYLLTQIDIHIVDDTKPIDLRYIGLDLANLLKLNSKREYLPIAVMSSIDSLTKRYQPLNEIITNVTAHPITVQIKPINFGKLRLFLTLENSVKSMKSLGFTDKDNDEIKSLFVDTNIYLLLVTFVVAFFHLLFDALAFKSDINFWRNKDSMVGISARTVLWRCFSQIIIFLYLLDEKTSLIVLIPTGIGSLIEVWKVLKAFKFRILWSSDLKNIKIQRENIRTDEKLTEQYDQEAMKYLWYLMYPLCFAGAIYSLLYTPHKSWYSWLINSLVNGVYAFGFIFMVPQLIINYKLKSVAHLPWRAFMYKAFNTFIDDLFAFIITMPTTHRIACFRDDIIFICYLYQRWLYPVDKTRISEEAGGHLFNDYDKDRNDKNTGLKPITAKKSNVKQINKKNKND